MLEKQYIKTNVSNTEEIKRGMRWRKVENKLHILIVKIIIQNAGAMVAQVPISNT